MTSWGRDGRKNESLVCSTTLYFSNFLCQRWREHWHTGHRLYDGEAGNAVFFWDKHLNNNSKWNTSTTLVYLGICVWVKMELMFTHGPTVPPVSCMRPYKRIPHPGPLLASPEQTRGTQVPGTGSPWRLISNLPRVTLPGPRILRWLLNFWKICTPPGWDQTQWRRNAELERILKQVITVPAFCLGWPREKLATCHWYCRDSHQQSATSEYEAGVPTIRKKTSE